MDRRLIAGVLGLIMAGCALGRSGMPQLGNHEPIAEADALPQIKDVINKVELTKDLATKPAAASLPEARSPKLAPPMLPPAPPAEAPPQAQGRPAPYVNQTGNERIQAAPASGRPEGQPPTARPAPFADQQPSAPREQAPLTQGTTPRPLPAMAPLLPSGIAQNEKPPTPEPTPAPTRDEQVVTTAGKAPSPPPMLARPKSMEQLLGAGGQAAMVGNEVITLDQLRRVLKEQLDRVSPEQRADPEIQKMMVDGVLNKLVERTMIIQAFKKKLKDPKNVQQVYDSVDKGWVEMELPPLLRAEGVANIYELKRKLAEKGRSLDQIREDFRLETLAHEFLLSNIQSKMHLSLPDRQDYYQAHLKDFDRPAQIVWREIVFENVKNASRTEAKRKTVALLTRLKQGEDFAKLARAESQGATAKEGGKWEMAPGGYGVPEINEILDKLPVRQISGIIEAPGGFHIVLVEERRQAGPARFDEVQDQIKDTMLRQKFAVAADGYIKNLRAKTLVTTMFDQPQSDPAAIRASSEQPAAR